VILLWNSYATILRPVVRKVALRGCAATVIAYGQTGSGKTHTVGALCDRFPVDLFNDLKSSAEALGLGEPLVDVEVTAVEVRNCSWGNVATKLSPTELIHF
jgi:DNA transposition AAA+ family ATPase